jgi:broad specificity phosphatase PhoE
MPKRIYLIRHGEIDGITAGRFFGATDLPLTARGRSQVGRLAGLLPTGLLAPDTETWCVASPLLRARQTAEAVTGAAGLAVHTDADLREMDFGAWEGLTAAEIEARFPGALERWIEPGGDTAFPGGESLDEFDARVARARERILARPEETVLVFTHGGVVRALICGLLGLGRECFWLFDVQLASVARVDLWGGIANAGAADTGSAGGEAADGGVADGEITGGAVLSGLWSVDDWKAD